RGWRLHAAVWHVCGYCAPRTMPSLHVVRRHHKTTSAPPQGKAAKSLESETLRLYLDFVLRNFQVDGLLFRRVGRSALRPGPVPRACEVDGPPPSSPKPRRI